MTLSYYRPGRAYPRTRTRATWPELHRRRLTATLSNISSVTGTASITEGGDTLTASGFVIFTGSVVTTETADTISGSGLQTVSGSGTITEGGDSVGSSGSASGTPSPALDLDLDAANYSTGTWTDTGPLGFNPSQATEALQPEFVADSGFKGKPGVRFSSSQFLSGSSMPLTNSRTKATVMVAFRSEATSPPGGAVFSTTQDQLAIMSDGRIALNTAAAEYGRLSAGATAAMLSLAGGQLITVVYDGTQTGNANRLRCWRNLVEETLTYTGTIPATTYAGGQDLYVGKEAAGAGWAAILMNVRFGRDTALTPQQVIDWQNYEAARLFTKSTKALVVSGDSNAVGSPNNTANPWPLRAQTLLGWASLTNSSTVGYKLSQGSASPQLTVRDDWYTRQPYIIALGTNDLAVDHADLATLQGLLNTLIAKLTAARYPIYVFTIPMAGTNIAGADETTRLAYNASLFTVSGITVIDVATALGDPTGDGDVNFEGDDLHYSDAGDDVVAELVRLTLSGDAEGDANPIETDDAVTAAGTLLFTGIVSLIESGDAANATGVLILNGTATISESADAGSGVGLVGIRGPAILIESGDMMAATVVVVSPATRQAFRIAWASRQVVRVAWRDRKTNQRLTPMQQYRMPARKSNACDFSDVIRNTDTDAIIDLTGFESVSVMVKRQGADVDTLDAIFADDRTTGEVIYRGYVFDEAGEWAVQFVATDPDGVAFYGEPIRITVAKNLDDLTTDELPIL